jgi:uncharacterized protein (DUF2235 family)
MKRLVICCDGTWNTLDQTDDGIPAPTNVAKIYAALLDEAPGIQDQDTVHQHKYYHPGVGTAPNLVDKAIGGGAGLGLNQNIMSGYRNLCDNYESGDEIFLFGFSRGAYTARSLAGLVGRCGLLDTAGLDDAEVWPRIEKLFSQGYRKRVDRSAWSEQGWMFHRTPEGSQTIPVRFVGVWDTVGALGIPDNLAVLNLLDARKDYTFYDTSLGGHIQTARHALALDEKRATFQPTLWTEEDGRDMKQIWFPGVHSDVGGGYAETGLSDGALEWMIGEAETCGLGFKDKIKAPIRPDHQGILHNSLTSVFKLLPTQPRATPALDDTVALHKSSSDRYTDPPITQAPYRPTQRLAAGVPVTRNIFAIEPWNDTGLWLEAGIRYELSATGEWKDKSIPCGPGGTNDGKFHAGEVVHLLGSALGKMEEFFKSATGNENANFLMTRRHEDMPWFCLVGAIANSVGARENVNSSHQTFMIGEGCSITPTRSGYLFAYANDAWRFYDNNRGRVQLTVSRQ